MRCEVRASKELPVLPQPHGGPLPGTRAVTGGTDGVVGSKTAGGVEASRDSSSEACILEICSRARKIIGFTPIKPRMIKLQKTAFGARDTEEAMLMEIKSYLKCEMKVKPSDIDKVDIVKIFPPAKEDWNTLYVEFGSESEVDKLFRYTRVMCKPDHRLVRWIPKELYERFRALESKAYNLRENMKSQGTKVKTRVKVGRRDLEFSVKFPNSGWKTELLPDGLPEIDLEAGRKPSLTSSPPPGRPERPGISSSNQERKRPLSGSGSDESLKRHKECPPNDKIVETDNTEVSPSNTNRQMDIQVDNVNIKSGNKDDKQDNLGLDIGKFTSTEGFSPATPAKAKNITDLVAVSSSPVFNKKVKKIQYI